MIISAMKGFVMKLLNKLERKFGKYAIHNLPAIMIGLYAAGYLLSLFGSGGMRILPYLTLEPYYILRGQIWRVITWVIVPPGSLDLFTVIMLFFYFSIGQTLERTWGAFRFTLYIVSGLVFTVLGAFLLYGIFVLRGAGNIVQVEGLFSTYYINMSIFLAFALSYPDMQVLLYFIIPVRMKWMGLLYAVLIAVQFFQSPWPGKVAIIASLLNFIVFFLATRSYSRVNPAQIRRRQTFKKAVSQPSAPGKGKPLHRCAVCGRTEQDDPSLQFRYCSRCDGAYEYCQDHLFNHVHKTKVE